MSDDLTRLRFEAFSQYVHQTSAGARWLVLTHDNPDPDALTSMALLARLLRQVFRRHVTIAYGGMIGRAENREVVRTLGLELVHLRTIDWRSFDHFGLVDSQPRTGNNQLPSQLAPHVVIDHHPLRKATLGCPFVDVRRDYGATATILTEYLLASGHQPTRRQATALVYALQAETQDFGRESAGPDHAVHDLLLPRIDKRMLARIQHARLPLAYFRNLHRALESLESVGTLVVSHLGPVDQPDIVPEIADLLLRLEGKTWSLCTGAHGDRIYLSIRTSNPRADAGNLMRRLLRRRGKGGGHGMMAGGWVMQPRQGNGENDTLARALARELATALKKNPERLLPLSLYPGEERGEALVTSTVERNPA